MRISDWVEGRGGAGVSCWRAGMFVNEMRKWARPVGWVLLTIFYVVLCVNYDEVCTWCGQLKLVALVSARS
jgi:hypothetical protein